MSLSYEPRPREAQELQSLAKDLTWLGTLNALALMAIVVVVVVVDVVVVVIDDFAVDRAYAAMPSIHKLGWPGLQTRQLNSCFSSSSAVGL